MRVILTRRSKVAARLPMLLVAPIQVILNVPLTDGLVHTRRGLQCLVVTLAPGASIEIRIRVSVILVRIIAARVIGIQASLTLLVSILVILVLRVQVIIIFPGTCFILSIVKV